MSFVNFVILASDFQLNKELGGIFLSVASLYDETRDFYIPSLYFTD
jgi:hypothetical protein